jgi:acyl-CoA thioesterase I
MRPMNRILHCLLVFILLCFSDLAVRAGEVSRLARNLEEGRKQTVVVYGTSLTAGGAWVGQFREELERRYPGRAVVINSGKSAMWSKWGVDNLDARVIEKRPDTVLIEFTINDAYLPYKTTVAQARANLETMTDRIRAAVPECEIILMVMNPPTGVHLERRPDIASYNQMVRDLAKERRFTLIDHYPAWERIRTSDPKTFSVYMPDGLHPGPEGCRAVITPGILTGLGLSTTNAPPASAGSASQP